MGLSGPNAHRRKYNFITESKCPKCNYKNEDVPHYLLQYPAHAAQEQRWQMASYQFCLTYSNNCLLYQEEPNQICQILSSMAQAKMKLTTNCLNVLQNSSKNQTESNGHNQKPSYPYSSTSDPCPPANSCPLHSACSKTQVIFYFFILLLFCFCFFAFFFILEDR